MELENLKERLEAIKKKLEVAVLADRIKEIETEMGEPAFWQDTEKAKVKSQELAELKKEIEDIKMLDLALAQNDLATLEKLLKDLELKTYLSGPYDKNNCIFSLHAGQGGTEAMDWTMMLERMYLRYFEKKGWEADVVDLTPGEEAGIKSVTILVSGLYAYGYLKNEAGVHRLVRQSPFNADKLRQTSFAKVEVLPQIPESTEIVLNESDLEWDFYRASSHGGQNVQKVSTAVKLTHKPTGIVVTAQSQRYQEQNRKIALSLLTAKLWELRQQEILAQKKELKGEVKIAGWGNQIRSYVFHPYKMVKDLRTGVETADTESVMNGEIDLFISASLKR